MREAFYMWLARRLPKKVIFWCFVRVLSSDSYAAHDATALAAAKGLVRWYEGKKAEEAQGGRLPASGAGRRPRAGVDGDLRSTWPGGPNPGVSRTESSCEGLRSDQRASSPSLDSTQEAVSPSIGSTHSRFSPPPIVDKNDTLDGRFPASGAERRPPAGVDGDRGSTWPGGPNPGVSREEVRGEGSVGEN